ncbi:pilin outer membrane usher protein SafC, partial [Escherichia coli]|uniref:FimD/PapC N-terminal domain-containing protein n=1 Tax=Escherichia coli TaxID=562 RepID=UPI002981B617
MRDMASGRIKTGVTGLALAVMAACVMLRAECSIARTYSFDESMLKGGGKGVDLTLFEEGGQLPGIYPVDIILNGSRVDSREMAFRTERDKDGRPYLKTCLTREMLARYGVRTEEYPALFRVSGEGRDASGAEEACADLTAIPQATENYRFAAQQLVLGVTNGAI